MKHGSRIVIAACAALLFVASPLATYAASTVPRTRAGQDLTALRLPDATFVPALIDPLQDRVENNRLADKDAFGRQHENGYEVLGRVSGYYQAATWGSIRFYYQGSVFESAPQALNAYRDGLATTGTSSVSGTIYRPPEGCATVKHHPCAILPYAIGSQSLSVQSSCGSGGSTNSGGGTSGNTQGSGSSSSQGTSGQGASGSGNTGSNGGTSSTTAEACAGYSTGTGGEANSNGISDSVAGGEGIYSAFVLGSCLVEAKAEGPASAFELGRDTVMTTFAAMLQAADQAATRACAVQSSTTSVRTDYSLIVARVERAHSPADFSLQTPGLRQAHVGTPVSLAAYLSVRQVPAGSTAVAEFTVQHGVGVQFFKRTKPQPITAGVTRIRVPFVPRVSGRDVVVARVTINGVTQQWTTAFNVIP